MSGHWRQLRSSYWPTGFVAFIGLVALTAALIIGLLLFEGWGAPEPAVSGPGPSLCHGAVCTDSTS